MTSVFALDTSCVIAAVCSWHEHHAPAAAEIERRLAVGDELSVSAQAMTEAYAVLTRFPAPHRLAPSDASELLRVNFVEGATVGTLSAHQQIAVLRRLAADGVSGGRANDALIAECAVKAGATALLTFNARHFEPAPRSLTIVVPS